MKGRKVVLVLIVIIDILIVAEAGFFIWQKLNAPQNATAPIKTVQAPPPPVITPSVTPVPPKKPEVVAKKSPPIISPEEEKPKPKPKPKPVIPEVKKIETPPPPVKKEEPPVVKPSMPGDVLFGFEDDLQGWEIPDWVQQKEDYVGKNISLSKDYASQGEYSLKLDVNFPGGGIWTAALVEIMQYFDWSKYSAISVDIYIPTGATDRLKGKIILTVGEDWSWIEMSRTIRLEPGKWTTIEANFLAGSKDWRQYNPTDQLRADVRKIAIRVDSDKYPVYSGPIYIDNIRLIK